MGKRTEHPTFQKIAWISVSVGGMLVLVGAIWLAVRAQSTDLPPKIQETSAAIRPGRAAQRPAKPLYPMPPPTLPGKARSKPATTGREAASERGPVPHPSMPVPAETDGSRPDLTRPALPPLRNVGRAALDSRVTPGRLSPEELARRRDERRTRQEERLKERIRTLEERIQTYRQDGTRTEAQIERMERSLERMRQRANRVENAGDDR